MLGRGRNYVMPLEKICRKCATLKPMDAFYRRLDRAGGRSSTCKSCVATLNAGRARPGSGSWQRTPEDQRRLNLRRYGITPQEFDEMLAAQGGVCAVCHGPAMGKGRYHVDHDHASGRVRGLLCHKCNVALGMVQDDPALLVALIAYIT